MILEGIVSTVNEDGSANVSPMGPLVDREVTRLVLRPYKTSRTYRNLKRHGKGILHVTDDVELLAHAAVGQLDPPPRLLPHKPSGGFLLADCCRWFAFEVALRGCRHLARQHADSSTLRSITSTRKRDHL